MTNTDWAIEAHGLVKDFRRPARCRRIDLKVATGIVYGVLGPNGAGKTTTIRMLATLLGIDEGEAKIFGYDVVEDAHRVRQLIGVTGQYASVDETLTARENLDIFCRLHGLTGKAVAPRATSCSSPSRSPMPRTSRFRSSPAECDAGSTSRRALSPGPRSSSWTSRPPDSTRALAHRCGTRFANSFPPDPPSFSPPSTSTRRTSSPIASRSSTWAAWSPKAPRTSSRPRLERRRCR